MLADTTPWLTYATLLSVIIYRLCSSIKGLWPQVLSNWLVAVLETQRACFFFLIHMVASLELVRVPYFHLSIVLLCWLLPFQERVVRIFPYSYKQRFSGDRKKIIAHLNINEFQQLVAHLYKKELLYFKIHLSSCSKQGKSPYEKSADKAPSLASLSEFWGSIPIPRHAPESHNSKDCTTTNQAQFHTGTKWALGTFNEKHPHLKTIKIRLYKKRIDTMPVHSSTFLTHIFDGHLCILCRVKTLKLTYTMTIPPGAHQSRNA